MTSYAAKQRDMHTGPKRSEAKRKEEGVELESGVSSKWMQRSRNDGGGEFDDVVLVRNEERRKEIGCVRMYVLRGTRTAETRNDATNERL
jgi:hypothetical protein